MKGVILAGGMGTRLRPLTKVTNKHLLPIYDKPMIYYPLMLLKDAGIIDIMIVTGGESIGDFLRLIGSGTEFGLNITYKCQEGSGGIPVALGLAKDFVDDKCTVILGDNISDVNLGKHIEEFMKGGKGAHIFLKKVDDPKRFGIANVVDGIVVDVIEKPENPPTDLAITGIYIFDKKVFDIIPNLEPSGRGELEITDVIRNYMKTSNLSHSVIDGIWMDAGTFESLFEASKIMYEKKKNKTIR